MPCFGDKIGVFSLLVAAIEGEKCYCFVYFAPGAGQIVPIPKVEIYRFCVFSMNGKKLLDILISLQIDGLFICEFTC
jgi:hypothetical protein